MVLTALLIALTVLVAGGTTGVGAQDRAETTLRVVDQNTFVAADGSLDLLLAIELPAAGSAAGKRR